MDGDMTTIRKPDDGGTKSFSFDHSYWSFDKSDPNYAGQQRLYDDLGVELLNHSFSGYNTCIVACKFFIVVVIVVFSFSLAPIESLWDL
jgi:kinesin family protein 1